MQWACHSMAHQKVGQSLLPSSTTVQHRAEPTPEKHDSSDLESPCPTSTPRTLCVPSFMEKITVGIGVEVETGEHHDDVEELVLDGYKELCEAIEVHGALVV